MLTTLLPVKISSLLLTLVCLFTSACSANLGNSHQAVVLQYHHVSINTPSSTSIHPQLFIDHLNLIDQQGFQVLPLPKVIQHLKQGIAFQQKTLAITFDDGYLSIYQNAYPELKKRHLPFTIFISPRDIDQKFGNSLSWQQLKEMQDNGATISNHSYQHLHLLAKAPNESPQQWKIRIQQDIKQSNKRLQDKLSINNKLFAYPYGEFNNPLKTLLKNMGYTAFSQQSGPISASSDMQALARFPASGPYANPKTLEIKLNSLAFHIVSASPVSQLLQHGDEAPKLSLKVKAQDVNYQQSQCFYMGSPMNTQVKKEGSNIIISAQLSTPLNPGRSRYNCTAPSLSKKCHYWYSMPFINAPKDGNWH